ncbi:MAG: insulinase family protein [Candidatus Harrisonbacteria bacterium]|nr:insulinase family protein [Candidatus Harrisonbacteria bacterium]
MKSFKRTILPNGLKIITVPHGGGLSSTILVLVEAGSKYETRDNAGISHFLEHMCFKGTLTRPTALALSSEFDGIGAEYNAFTSKEHTGYYAKVLTEKLDHAIELVADLYSNPIFDDKEINKERGVIIEEMNMYEDLPRVKVEEVFESLVYGDTPAGWPIIGFKDIIRKVMKEDFIAYRSAHYVTSATTVVVSGEFDEEKVIQKIADSFANIKDHPKSDKEKVIEIQSSSQVVIEEKTTDQTHLVVGLRAFSEMDPRKEILEVISSILGGNMSSRLFQSIREELGAAYYVRSGVSLSTDHGLLGISCGIDKEKLYQVIDAIMHDLRDLRDNLVLEEELNRAKDSLAARLLLGLESSDNSALFYGTSALYGKAIDTPEELYRKIKAVTAEDIRSVMQEIAHDNRLNLALLGPFKKDQEKDLLSHLYF